MANKRKLNNICFVFLLYFSFLGKKEEEAECTQFKWKEFGLKHCYECYISNSVEKNTHILYIYVLLLLFAILLSVCLFFLAIFFFFFFFSRHLKSPLIKTLRTTFVSFFIYFFCFKSLSILSFVQSNFILYCIVLEWFHKLIILFCRANSKQKLKRCFKFHEYLSNFVENMFHSMLYKNVRESWSNSSFFYTLIIPLITFFFHSPEGGNMKIWR